MVSTGRRYEVTDDEWERIKPYLPKNKRRIKRASSSRFPEDAKWNLLDSAKRSSLERSTRKVWSLADCI